MKYLACIILLLVAGCTSLQTPTARVTDVRVSGQSATGASVAVRVKVHNPNDVVLPLVKTQYRLAVAGLKTFDFTRTPDLALPAHGDQTLTLTAGFGLKPGETIQGRVYALTGSTSIQPPGKMWQIFHQTGVPLPKATFSKSGRFIAGDQ